MSDGDRAPIHLPIWWLAFGYFACYAPYSALAKALTNGRLSAGGQRVSGLELLPTAVVATVLAMALFLVATGWWRYASSTRVGPGEGVPLPHPSGWTLLSGLCTAVVIGTTTLAYTFEGVSIVFVMLLMRGGVLILAPVVDKLMGRHVRWFAWTGLLLSLAALITAFSEKGGYAISVACAIDVGLYLTAYFVRFRLMTGLAKSHDPTVNRRYFVEEALVSSPALLIMLAVVAAIPGDLWGVGAPLRTGFTAFWARPEVTIALLIGVLSAGTGIFGNLIYLDQRENTFCVPVNRSSSILAGVVASFGISFWLNEPLPSAYKLAGAAMIIAAIAVLGLAPRLKRPR